MHITEVYSVVILISVHILCNCLPIKIQNIFTARKILAFPFSVSFCDSRLRLLEHQGIKRVSMYYFDLSLFSPNMIFLRVIHVVTGNDIHHINDSLLLIAE